MASIRHIIKASGGVEPFSIDKLRSSLKRSGAGSEVVDEVAREVEARLYEGITTRKIYQMAFSLLNRKKQKPAAAKYSIKRAIMGMGPSGFPFEKYVSVLMASMGYEVKINQFVKGECVQHEVDVVAENEHSICMIECKYHNLQGVVSDVKVPLYVDSRFRDIRNNAVTNGKTHEGWIVTNTRFSADAMQYGSCAGLHLLGWDYPAHDNLKELIDRFRLYPISVLTSLTKRETQQLMENGIVLCRDLISVTGMLERYNISGPRVSTIINEAMALSRV